MKKLTLLILLLLPVGVQADEMEILRRTFSDVGDADLSALYVSLSKVSVKEQKKLIVVFARKHKRSPREILRELNNTPRVVPNGLYWARYGRTVPQEPWVYSLEYLGSEIRHLHRLHAIRGYYR